MKLGLKRAASLSCFGIIVRTHEPTIETRCLDTNSCPEYSFLAQNFLKFREVMYFANRYQKDFLWRPLRFPGSYLELGACVSSLTG